MVNKRGWMKIAEAFIAIILLMGIVLFVINRDSTQTEDAVPVIQNVQASILREIQLNDTTRAEIIATNGEINWTNFTAMAPNTRLTIIDRTPGYLGCEAKICNTNGPCEFSITGQGVYAKSVIISSTLTTFNPRMLKLFCWDK